MSRKTPRTMTIHLQGIILSNIQSPLLSLHSGQCSDPAVKCVKLSQGLGYRMTNKNENGLAPISLFPDCGDRGVSHGSAAVPALPYAQAMNPNRLILDFKKKW